MTRKLNVTRKNLGPKPLKPSWNKGGSISHGPSRLSIPEGTLGQWITAARKGLVTPPESRSVAELESEDLRLRNALNEAQLERDILNRQL